MPVPSVISDLSTTPASNSPAGSETPSSTDDYLRTQASFIKQLATSAHIWCGTATGTANALALTPSVAITAYVAGLSFRFKASLSNSGVTTIAVSGLAAIDLEISGIACAGGEILAGKWYEITLSSATKAQLSNIGSLSANLTTAFNEKRSTVALTATTSPIWTAGVGKIIDGTGTPTITDFPAAPQAGAQREIYPAAGTILTHGGNISVQGNASATAAAGDKWIITAPTTTTFDVEIVKKNGTSVINAGVNAVHNGSGIVQQRSAPTLTAALQYGAADRHLIGVTGGTGISGTAGILSNSGFSCGIGYGAIAASWTSGQFVCKHRIEGANTKQFNGKTVTVSGKIYQDTGAARDFTIAINRPTSTLDTFSALTNVATSSAIAIASGSATNFSFTYLLSASDADLGLEIAITDSAANTVATKNYAVSDLQFEEGSQSTFKQRPYGLELILCQRYLPTISGNLTTIGSGSAYSTTHGVFSVAFPVTTRIPPTGISVTSAANYQINDGVGAATVSAVSIAGSGTSGCQIDATAAGLTQYRPYYLLASSSDKIIFTGCEL